MEVCRENQNIFYFQCPFYDSVAVYEIAWKNIVEPGRPQKTKWRMRLACWIPKAINTHSEYVILISFPLQQWFHERSSMLRYTYIVYVVRNVNHLHLPRIEALFRDHSEVTNDRDAPALGEGKTMKSNVLLGFMSRSSECSSLSARSLHTTKQQQPPLPCQQHSRCFFIGLSS